MLQRWNALLVRGSETGIRSRDGIQVVVMSEDERVTYRES